MSTTLSQATSQITEPIPATGSMRMSDSGNLHLEFDLDFTEALARAVMTKTMPDLASAFSGALSALVADLAPKFGAALSANGVTSTVQ